MNAIEFETRTAERLLEHYRKPPVDVLTQGFRPVGGSCVHLAPVRHDGAYHFIYSELRLASATGLLPGNALHFGHASTTNFLEWRVHEPAFAIRPGTWESTHVLDPTIIPYDGRYLMAYAATNDAAAQDIGLAISEDLHTWTRLPDNPVSPARGRPWAFWRNTGPSTCRAPFLFENEGRVYLAYSAVTRDGASCIALASSTDLAAWEDHGPGLTGPRDGYIEVDPGETAPQEPFGACALLHAEGRWRLMAYLRTAGQSGTCWLFESDDLHRFDFETRREFWRGSHAAHPVKHAGARSLLVCPGLVRFGEVDWSAPEPTARYITTREELEAWKD